MHGFVFLDEVATDRVEVVQKYTAKLFLLGLWKQLKGEGEGGERERERETYDC